MVKRSQLLLVSHVDESGLLLQQLPHDLDSSHPGRAVDGVEQGVLQPQIIYLDSDLLLSSSTTGGCSDSTAM
jgi:hypothetical protein